MDWNFSTQDENIKLLTKIFKKANNIKINDFYCVSFAATGIRLQGHFVEKVYQEICKTNMFNNFIFSEDNNWHVSETSVLTDTGKITVTITLTN